jgi:hypothetical protein
MEPGEQLQGATPVLGFQDSKGLRLMTSLKTKNTVGLNMLYR